MPMQGCLKALTLILQAGESQGLEHRRQQMGCRGRGRERKGEVPRNVGTISELNQASWNLKQTRERTWSDVDAEQKGHVPTKRLSEVKLAFAILTSDDYGALHVATPPVHLEAERSCQLTGRYVTQTTLHWGSAVCTGFQSDSSLVTTEKSSTRFDSWLHRVPGGKGNSLANRIPPQQGLPLEHTSYGSDRTRIHLPSGHNAKFNYFLRFLLRGYLH